MFDDVFNDVYYGDISDIKEMFCICSKKFTEYCFRMIVHQETNFEEGKVTLIKNGKIIDIPLLINFLGTKIDRKILSEWKQEYVKCNKLTTKY